MAIKQIFFRKYFLIIVLALIMMANLLGNTVVAVPDNKFEFERDNFSFENFDHRPLSFDESYETLKLAEWTKSFPDWAVKLLANLLVELNERANGYCWGMPYTAKYYYENPEIFKVNYPEYSCLYEVPEEEIVPEIVRNQWLSVFTDETILYNSILFLGKFQVIEEQVDYILSRLDNNCPELIMFDIPNGFHVVLAYDYEITDSNYIIIQTYDSNNCENSIYLTFFDQAGEYELQESYLAEKYEYTIISCATFGEPDWNFVLENNGAVIEGVVDFLEGYLSEEETNAIYMGAIVVLSVFLALSVIVLIALIVLIRRANSK